MYNPYQNTGYFQQQPQQQQQQQQQQHSFGQQNPQASGFGGMPGSLSSTPMNFPQLQAQQQPSRFGGANTAVNPTGMSNLMPQSQSSFGSQQNTGMMGMPGPSNTASATSNQGNFVNQPQQQHPQSTGYFQSNALPLQQPQLQSQPTGFQNPLLSNPTGGMQPLLPQSTGFYHPTGGMPQAPLEPLKPTATGLVNSFANGGLNHDIKIPARRLSFITSNDQAKFETLFRSIVPKGSNTISGEDCKKIFLKSGLQASELAKIWKLSDTTRAGELLFPEFALAMHLVNDVLQGDSIPYELDTKTKNEVGSFVDAINLSIARGDGDPGPKTPFDDLMMGGLKPQSTGFMPPTSFGMPLQGQVTGGGAGLLNPQRTGFMPQTSFGMPMQPTGGAQFNPMGNMGGNAGVGIQSTGFMPQTSFGAPLQSQLTGGAVQRQPTGGFQNNFMPNMQPQNTGGFAALQPQKIQPQATGSLLPQGTGGLRPQTTGSFQQQQQQQQQLGGFQPQPTGGFQPQPTDGFQPQLNGGLQPQGTGGFQQQGFGGGIQPQLTGGFQQPQPSGGFQQPQPTGGFQQPQPSGGFQQPQPSGGFQQPQPSGGFQQPQPSGGFQQAQPSGGFQQPQPTGGLQPQSTGPLQPQGTGFGQQGGGVPPLQPQGTGSFNGNLPQQPNGGFQGVPPPQQQPQLTGGLMPQATGGASTAVPIQQTGLSTQSTGFLPPSGFNPTQPLSAQKTGFGNNEIYTQSSFSQDFNGQNLDDILPEEKSLFYKIFQTYDTDKRGILDASKAVEIFRKSGLNRGDLEHIWALCDINNTGQLNKQEFALGMHLVYRKLNGFQLPNRLPLNLIPSSTKILDDVKNQIKSSVGTEDRRSSTKTDALSYKNNDDEDVLPSFRNRRKVFGANAPPATTNQDASAPAASASASAASQQAKPNVSDLKRAINERRQRLDTEKARLQTTTSDDDLRFISSLKSQIGELPSISVVNDSVPADLKERYETLLVKLPNLFVQIDEIDTQIRNAKLQLFKMKNPFSISGSGPNGEITDEDRKKAKSKALLKSRMNALTGKPSGPIGSFEEEEVKYNEEIKKINAGCNSNKEIIGDIKSSIADIAASLESGLSGGSIHANPGDFEVWEFGTRLEPEVRDFVYSLRTKTSQREQGNSSTVSAEANYSQQNYSQPAAQDVSRQTYGNLPQSTSNGYSQQPVDNNSTPVTSSNSQSYNFTDPSGNYRSQATVNSYSYSSNGNRSDNYNSGGSNQTSRQPSYAGGTSHNQPSSNEVVNGDDGEDEEEKQLRDKLEMLKLKKKSEKEKRLADLRRQIEEAKADGDEEAEVAALQNVANQRSTSSISISQDPAPSAASPALNQGRDGHPNVNSSHPSYGSAPAAHAGVNATRSSTVMSASPVSSVASPQPSGQGGRNAFFKQTPSTSSSFDLRAAETQRRLQRGLDDDESEGWSDDDNANAQTASPPKEPVPSAPYQQAPTPVAPAPVAPAPVAPAPVAPSNEEPKPMAPSLPQVKDDGPPVPVAPPLPQVQHQGPPVPVAPPLPQMQSESKPFFAGPPPLMPNEDENGGHGHGHGHEEEKHYADENDDDDDSLSIPESVGSDEDNFEMAHSAPSNIPPPPPLP